MAKVDQLLDGDFMRKLEQLSLVSRKIFAGRMKGERRSKKRGFSVEFADYRDYSHGDDLRFIDWNAYGRLDRLFIKLFMEEEDLHVHLLIDTSLSMGFGAPSKLEYAKKVAAALAYIALSGLDRVGVYGLTENGFLDFPLTRGKKTMWKMLDFVVNLPCSGGTSLLTSCKRFAVRHPGKGVLVVLSDFLDKEGYEQALKYFLYEKMDVFVLQILAEEEVHPTYVGDLKLVDSEDSDVAEVSITASLVKNYEKNLRAYCGTLKEFCTRHGFNYLFAPTSIPFDQLVLNYLRSAGLFK
ncbi:MAG: DUF58 domain-containing protein [Planctomycetes bacterium]|nr:DUF58 domain-containing protein [Planctomycetota bacterium]